jgi:acyl-CoA hydrolase
MTDKYCKESRTVFSNYVLPPDTNNHGTLFGGKLVAYIDDVAARAAMKHSRRTCVTASMDSIDFIAPVKANDEVVLEAFVTWTHHTSMEVFVKVIDEDLLTGEREVCVTAFLTFVALDDLDRPTPVPGVIPESPEEIELNQSASKRAETRKLRRTESKRIAARFGVGFPWER